MEQALRERRLSSASIRRQRIQEREEQRLQAKKEARARVLVLEELSDCESQSDSETDNPGSGHSREDSCETSSEYSLSTPHDTPQAMYDKTNSALDDSKPPLRVVVPETPVHGRQLSNSDTEPPPKLQASLATLSDFRYDRFSIFVESPAEIVTSPVYDTDEQESLCEVATPVSFSMPRAKPAVVSIVSNKSSTTKRRTSSSASSMLQQATSRSATMPPELPTRNANRLSQSSQRSGFLASEAAPLQVPDLPPNAMYMIANASRDSLAISTHSAEPTMAAPTTRPRQSRKHSMPLLSAAFRSSHSRMSSIKGLVSPALSNPNPRSSQIDVLRPRTAIASESMSFETVPADLNDPLPIPRPYSHHRPSTSHASSVRSGSVTALPTPPLPPSERQTRQQTPYMPQAQTPREKNTSPEPNPRRKKSFSSLRMRSESISNVMKFVSGGGGQRNSRMPPAPSNDVPPVPSAPATVNMSKSSSKRASTVSADLGPYKTPPPPMPTQSPAGSVRKSGAGMGGYSMFPTGYGAGSRGMVGLGIRT
jgi:hypothetical protein